MAVHWGGRGPGHLSRGIGNRYPPAGTPSLVLDFIQGTGLTDYTLDISFSGSWSEYADTSSLALDFTTENYLVAIAPEPTYAAYVRDPVSSDAYINLQVWN